eukprot:TRINITY_DN3953_c0_g1_i1.p1 TRINITY_DN3953_c0_g1~~TRINITY_DN3953_c0_g1_i1.p1  ORF type:complete len:141 (-),score=20.06 TRINITY_DN3953_c0_g1_i1:21-443(-)
MHAFSRFWFRLVMNHGISNYFGGCMGSSNSSIRHEVPTKEEVEDIIHHELLKPPTLFRKLCDELILTTSAGVSGWIASRSQTSVKKRVFGIIATAILAWTCEVSLYLLLYRKEEEPVMAVIMDVVDVKDITDFDFVVTDE